MIAMRTTGALLIAWVALSPIGAAQETPAEPPAAPPGETEAATGTESQTEAETESESETEAETETGTATETGTESAGEELILDPELEGVIGPTEAIVDPELSGVESPDGPGELEPPPPADPNGRARVVLHTRVGIDSAWQDTREDVIEATQLALFELQVRRSEDLAFAVGLRGRYLLARRDGDSPDAAAARQELDITPTAAYADVGLGGGAHLRLGWQTSHLGRFDVLSATNVLGVYDLRSGPATLPEASDVAQPAMRLDWELGESSALQLRYLPVFQGHLVHTAEGDYALLPSTEASVEAALGTATDPQAAADRAALLRRTLSRSGQARLAQSGLDAFAPDPTLKQPQAAARLTFRGAAAEGALTAATALERLPTIEVSPVLLLALADPSDANLDALAMVREPIAVEHGRFAVFSADGALDVGPIQLGAEGAFVVGRTLFAAQTGQTPVAAKSNLAHLGLRLEFVQGEDWVLALESMAQYTLQEPDDPARAWMFLTEGRAMLAAIGFLGFSPAGTGMTLELAGGVLSGPSYLVLPRAEFGISDGLAAELGALVMGGERPGMPGDPAIALGGLYADVDQVFVGLRWLP